MNRLAALVLCFSSVIWGQGSSTINGTVADPSGAVVPTAKITLVEVDTHLSREAVCNAEGFFVFGGLRPTRYSIKVEAAGFRTYNQSEIILLYISWYLRLIVETPLSVFLLL